MLRSRAVCVTKLAPTICRRLATNAIIPIGIPLQAGPHISLKNEGFLGGTIDSQRQFDGESESDVMYGLDKIKCFFDECYTGRVANTHLQEY